LLAGPAAAADRITLDDMLNAEDLDAQWSGSAFSPDGSALAYTVNAANSSRPTWGYDTAALQTMTHVFVSLGGGAPHEIEGTSSVLYSLAPVDPWTPDGKGLLLIATQRDSYGFAHYDLASGKITPLPGRIYNSFVPISAWAPDGRFVYTTIRDSQPQARADGQVLEDLRSRWNRTWSGGTAAVTVHSANPVFTPTQKEPGMLMLGVPTTGATQKIADGDYLAVSVSPSGRQIGAIKAGDSIPNALSWTGKRGELQIFTLASDGAKITYRISDLDVASFDRTSWSPSGKSLLVVARARDAKAKEAKLYVVDVASGKYHELATTGLTFEKPSPDSGIYASGWLGETPVGVALHEAANGEGAVMTGLAGTTTYEYGQARNMRTDLFAFTGSKAENLSAFSKTSIRDFVGTDGALLVVSDGALWSLAPGRAAEQLSAAGTGPIIAFATDIRNPPRAAQTAYYHSGSEDRVSVTTIADGKPQRAIFDLHAKSLSPLAVKGDVVVSAPDQRKVLTRIDDGWSSSFVLDDGAPHQLVTVNAALKDRAIAPIEKFTYTVGKRTLNGFVVWPPGASKSAKLPAVVNVYGGTVFGDQPPSFSKPHVETPIFSGQLLAAEGFAVIYPSTPLGAGADSDQPQQLADAVIAAIDAVAAGGRIDPQRVGVMGQSYGGFSTAALLSKRSDRLKAGVSMAGLYDFIHAYGEPPFDFVFSDEQPGTIFGKFIETGQGALGKPFWQAPDAYMRISPIFHVETLDSPLLMLHGDLDLGATDLLGAERMYASLLRAGKKPALVHYWGEGHVAQSAAAVRDQWMRITTWFNHYLKNDKK
jgi:dipeptidyl aminopeptidase/acylaminoacyl peptidase